MLRTDEEVLRFGGGGVVGGGGLGLFLMVIAAMFLGIDPGMILEQAVPPEQTSDPDSTTISPGSPEEEELAEFVSVVLGYTEETWQEIFRERGELEIATRSFFVSI